MKAVAKFFSFCLLLAVVSSCTAYKKVPYLQFKGSDQKKREVVLSSFYRENTIRFQPDDIIAITVNVIGVGSGAIASDYNLPLQSVDTGESEVLSGGYGRQTYLVDKNGQIDFPVLGLIRVSGYTQSELQAHIKKLIMAKYLKVEPVITVRLMNFRITVTGEVNRPGQIVTNKDHLNLVEALALAGDMTIYGKRDGILLLRETPDGNIKMIPLDISKAEIVSSPYFYLRQNDVLYVSQTTARARVTDVNPQTSTILGIGSFLISVVSFVLLITNK
jgi:polysaccharide export outer membrane protein